MRIGFASKALRACAERVPFWLAMGAEFVHADGTYRLEREPRPGDRRQPSPAPVPAEVARAAIAAGAPVRRDGDLFGRAA